LIASGVGAALQKYASGGFAEVSPARIATLPVAILLGPWHGIVATLLATLAGAVHPRVHIIRLLEALVVGIATRRGRSPLIAGGLFWFANAILFALAPALYGVGQVSWSLVMQQLLNKMVPMVVANLLASAVSFGLPDPSRGQPRRLRSYAFHAFVLVAILPVVVLSAATGQLLSAQQEAEGSAQLTAIATARRDRIQEFVESHIAVIETLASALSRRRSGAATGADRQLPAFPYHLRPHHDRRSARNGPGKYAGAATGLGTSHARSQRSRLLQGRNRTKAHRDLRRDRVAHRHRHADGGDRRALPRCPR